MTTTTEEREDMAKAKATTERELVRFGTYLWADQLEALQELQARTGVTAAFMIREGIDRELAARGVKVKGSRHGK